MPHELARFLDDRNAADPVRLHQLERFGERLVGRHGDRIDHHPALEPLHLAHRGRLLLDVEVAVKHADPAELRERDRHVGLGHRVHRRGQDRDVERDFAGQEGARCRPGSAAREDSSGCSRTSSNVSPSGMSAASLSWAISAHDRRSAIRQASAQRAARSSTRCAASTCMRSIISLPKRSAPPWKASTRRSRALDLGARSARTRDGRARSGSGWIRLLPSKPSRRPSSRLARGSRRHRRDC